MKENELFSKKAKTDREYRECSTQREQVSGSLEARLVE
tara:strand:+ start:766 stop:879 length:114 start_codon:yes stop_codon:yes gene_type:complete